MNSVKPRMSFHKLEHGRDLRFWSVGASSDIRMIVHRTAPGIIAQEIMDDLAAALEQFAAIAEDLK